MSTKTISIIAVMAILMVLVSAVAGTVITQNVEIRGSVMDGNGTYDYANFAGFWYDLDENHSSETMAINVSVRTIDKGKLVYECTPHMINYTSHGLLANPGYEQYKIIGFMADKYICYDNRTDQLVKLLIEWDSSDKTVLSMNGSMELPGGYMLVAQEIDLAGDKVWLKFYKDGKEIDNDLILGGDTYIYEDEDDVLLFSAQIESVFRGTESNMVVVKYVFLRSDTILDIDGGDSFGIMEVKSTSGKIVLENDETVTLDTDSEVEIMDGLYFKVADDDKELRYYRAKTISLTCPDCPGCPECPVVDPCPPCNETGPCPEVTPEVIIEYVNVSVPAEEAPKKDAPGFEAVFAIAGLLAVAYLVLRQRK